VRILYVVHGFPPDTWAGTEVYTLELARAMHARGHAVAVATRAPPKDGDEPDWTVDEETFDGLRVHRIRRRVERLPIAESYRPEEAVAAFFQVVDRERPDVVHFQHVLHLSVDLVPAARTLGIPCVVTLNDYWPLCARVQLLRPDGVRCEKNQGMGCFPCVKDKDPRLVPIAKAVAPIVQPVATMLDAALCKPGRPKVGFRSRIARFARSWLDLSERNAYVLGKLAQADLLVAPSAFLRERFLETGFFDAEKIVHSDYGTRMQKAAIGAKRPSKIVRFAYVGSLVEHKGVATLVEAASRLDPARAELGVHGAFRPEDDAYHARLEGLAYGGPVRFRGPFDHDRIGEIHREIDVLVVPSLWFENSPLTIHEAFLHGTPVVASGIGGMRELVRDGVDGFHARPGDADHLASVLKRFVNDPSLAARLARNLPRVKTIEEDVLETEARYRDLARGR
jgi:glycosyltransferase involved in cell wall biosynthesis